METVKKNLLSIICGVVVILALVALLWPISGWATQLQASVDTSKKNYYDQIQTLEKASRKLPITTLDANAEQPPLDRFPTQPVIEAGEKARDQVQKQSQQMLELTIEKNRHTPILPMSVGHSPDPYAFKRAYLQTLGQWEAPADMPTLPKILQSVTPPDEKEIDDEAKRIYDKEFQPRIIIIDGKAQNEAEVKAQFEQTKQKLPEKMRRERAEQYKIYLEPDALEVSGPLDPKETKPATPDQIWYAQNMLWIDQDIAEAIARINKSSKNIMDAPVKQLIKVSVPNDASQYITLQNQLGAGAKGDNAPTLDDNALAGKAYALSETGRISNPMYDVLHFEVEMNVDARKVPAIIAELQRGKLITVYTADTKVVDARAAIDDGYVYGDAPVVNLRLQCEELMMRGWTVGKDPAKDALMPNSVELTLGIVQPPNQ